jgi:hypothetical protein
MAGGKTIVGWEVPVNTQGVAFVAFGTELFVSGYLSWASLRFSVDTFLFFFVGYASYILAGPIIITLTSAAIGIPPCRNGAPQG